MKNGVPQDRLQPDKEYVSVENRVAGPELDLKPPRQQKALKHHAAPPNNQAEHFPPAQIRKGRVGGNPSMDGGEDHRAASPLLKSVL